MSGTFRGHYLDGRSAARQAASIRLAASGLEITLESGARLWWPFGQVRQTQGAYDGEQIRLERRGGLPEALVVDEPGFLMAVQTSAPPTFRRRFHDPRRRPARALVTVLAALGAVAVGAVLYGWGIPLGVGLLAARLPVSWEERLGAAAVEQLTMARPRCLAPEGAAAIDAIVRRLLEPVARVPYTFQVSVVDDPAVNAFAVPGGRIVVLRGLLERTRTPEELAGVLAHEIQHVLKQHATRLLLQHASTGFLLIAVSGDLTGVVPYGIESARVLGTLRYSRDFEREADGEGLRMLLAADVDPRPMIGFFEKLAAAERGLPSAARYLTSHPLAADRVAELKRLAGASPGAFRPLLSERAWSGVTRACAQIGSN